MKVSSNQIEEFITNISGREGLPIYQFLKGKEDVNEFSIVEKLKIPINDLRNILYRFDAQGLLSSKRKKDRKKGWYIYFWTLDQEKIKQQVIKFKQQRLKHLEKRLIEEEASDFYYCPNNCTRVNADEALEIGYMCPECGQVLELEDSIKIKNRLKKDIATLKEEIIKKSLK